MAERESSAIEHRAKAPVFLLSFRHRDELAAAAGSAGWQAIAARRADNAEQRFITSGALVAVVDARGSFDEGLSAVHDLSDVIEITASALLVLVSRGDVAALDAILAAGATHYLASPFKDAEFIQSLRFAERHSVRLSGGARAAAHRHELAHGAALTWYTNLEDGDAYVSDPLRNRLSITSNEVARYAVFAALDDEERAVGEAAVARVLETGNPTAFTHLLPARDGNMCRVAHHLRTDPARSTIFGNVEILETETPIRGGRDRLTGVRDAAAARRWIDARLEQRGESFFVILLAITRFEMINTAFGRDTGDHLLQSVARMIGRLVAESGNRRGMIARTAGAEFIIGLDGSVGEPRALLLAEHLAEQIERPIASGTHLVSLSCRIAIVESTQEDADASQLLRRASGALADAKVSDHGRIRMVNRADQSSAAYDQSLQSDLRRALDNDEIEMLFQPQVSIPTGRIIGVEALARWRHPVHGELGAATLFAVAEQSDYMLALSQHIQQRAAMQAAAWPSELSALRLAVNITASDIGRTGFADQFLSMIDSSGFPRGRLTVEVTESGLIEDLGAAASLLAALRAGGCRVAIDDFGTGYSSLAYLKALPLDYLKIDKKLAQDIAGSSRDKIVVRGVIDMARSLGLAVIAEGVETEEQLSLLAREGCNYYQGFLCAEALGVDALTALVTQRG